MDYTKAIRCAYAVIMTILVLLILMSFYDYFVERSLLKAFLFIYSSTYLTICIWTASAFIYGIFMRLKSMVNVFERILESHDKQDITKVKPVGGDEKEIVIIKMMIEIYTDLADVFDNINLCYSFSAMLSYGLVFFHTLFTYFVIVRDYNRLGAILQVSTIAYMYAVYYNFLFFVLIFVNTQAANSVSN